MFHSGDRDGIESLRKGIRESAGGTVRGQTRWRLLQASSLGHCVGGAVYRLRGKEEMRRFSFLECRRRMVSWPVEGAAPHPAWLIATETSHSSGGYK